MKLTESRISAALWWSIVSLLQLSSAQNETLTATTSAKYLTSPGYPTSYPNDLVYDWLITSASVNELVKIEVPDCKIEYLAGKVPACQVDKLEIFDGAFDNATVLYQSCCLTSVPAMNSSGQYMLIRFTTDSSDTLKGFQIKYYNTGYIADDVAAAFGLYIAIALIAVAIVVIVAVASFYIYKMKKSKEHRVNPVGGEGVNASTSDNKYTNPEIDEYKKPPLPADSPVNVPAPKAWSEIEGMDPPITIGPKPDLIMNQNTLDGPIRGNKLPPIQLLP